MNDSAVEAQRLEAAYDKRPQRSSWSSAGHLFGQQERERLSLALLRRHRYLPLDDKTILEVGCGSGTWILQFIRWGARPEHIAGLDVRPRAIAQARSRVPAAVRLELANAAALPFPADAFDLVLQATVFTSVLDRDLRRQIASEMIRVVKPTGLIMWYDFQVNNARNPDVRAVPAHEIRDLFTGCRIELRRVTLAPPVIRWLAPHSWLATYLLSQIPPFCTHCLGAITKRPSAT
ncbi:MAG: class I SAM-dependent methyltransferase [Gemmatimonadales bacterium]